MESNVAISSGGGAALASKDYSSPDGANGYYILNAKWSPDSQFFVFSMMSSGGHSPWSFPIWVYSVKKNAFTSFSDMINGSPTLSGTFTIAKPHTLNTSTWKQPAISPTKSLSALISRRRSINYRRRRNGAPALHIAIDAPQAALEQQRFLAR